MAEQNCSSTSSQTPVIITTNSDVIKQDLDHSDSISSSCDSRIFSDKKCTSSDEAPVSISQSHQSNSKLVNSDSAISSSSESRNGVSDSCDKSNATKSSSFLRPSALGSGLSNSTTKNTSDTLKCPLKSPKLNLAPSKFGNADSSSLSSSSSKSPYSQSKNPFTSAVSFADASESPPKKELKPEGDGLVNSSTAIPPLATFANASTRNNIGTTVASNSPISVPNFVFGQNLHERVTDNLKASSENDGKSSEATTSNGTSDMLFTSALTSKEVVSKENLSSEVSTNSNKEASSLLEDAARCQEARAVKRKYEEVMVTTGEEEEENILPVNVKLFAFDNGTWVERGRGTLRLNDKNCDGVMTSRIVIRTVGSLRVVLNTKIWSGMTLNRASDRSVRLTALDPNGQLKIFLIQASPKDMATLYRHLEFRVKRCQERDPENKESPEKKIALDTEANKT